MAAKRVVTLHGLNPGSDVIRVVEIDDPLDLPFEIERFKRDWRKRGAPFVTVEVER
jgi:hypothetical protein